MKHLAYLFILFQLPVCGQQLFDFEEDSLTGWIQSPGARWETAAENALEGNFSLHHAYDNMASGVDYIGRNIHYPDLNDTIRISFRIRHGYNPSSGNNWQLFLLANDFKEMEAGNQNSSGIILGVNYQGSDDRIKLWYLKGGEALEICDSELNYQQMVGTTGVPTFVVTRVPGGRWIIGYGAENSPDFIEIVASREVNSVSSGKYMGYRYAYSSAQDRKLWVDDIRIEGNFYSDTVPPEITDHVITGLNSIDLTFNEDVLFTPQTVFSRNGNLPDSIKPVGDGTRLYFSENFPNRITEQLLVSGVADLEDNYLEDTVILFRQELAEFGDVVINEIMPDPDPRVYLPSCEYVELFNRYDYPIAVDDWSLEINSRSFQLFPVEIMPGECILMTHELCSGQYGNINEQPGLTSSTALPNAGATLRLFDQYNRLIHLVEYDGLDQYDKERSDGGWSLEISDPDNLCGGDGNWHVSEGWRGGTPGEKNSLVYDYQDSEPPVLKYIGIPEDGKLTLSFNEHIYLLPDSETAFILEHDTLSPEVDYHPLVSKTPTLLSKEFFTEEVLYNLQMINVEDCSGNRNEITRVTFKRPVLPGSSELVLNEIMYDPVFGGSEYIEIYNAGNGYLDLYDLKLKLIPPGALEGSVNVISGESHLLFPGRTVVLCKNENSLRREWDLGWEIDVVEVADFRTLPNDGTCIQLTDRSGNVIDQMCYNDSLHHDLVGITSGVALERMHPGSCNSGSQCWVSAASSVNYGTPGALNSQQYLAPDGIAEITLNTEVFSPDMDGFEDILVIGIHGSATGSIVDVFITDMDGNSIRNIVNNGQGGSEDLYFWDGLDQHGNIVLPGIYIVHLRIHGKEGSKIYRKPCAVIYR
ncbi:MAG: lamin tail domain-containing protein [Bacteroidales bacterium]